ncbi:MAG: hypothetical protein ACI4IV_01930, partial [Acutalibacteraceae bacterium]
SFGKYAAKALFAVHAVDIVYGNTFVRICQESILILGKFMKEKQNILTKIARKFILKSTKYGR